MFDTATGYATVSFLSAAIHFSSSVMLVPENTEVIWRVLPCSLAHGYQSLLLDPRYEDGGCIRPKRRNLAPAPRQS
jgi:hypothetical protein